MTATDHDRELEGLELDLLLEAVYRRYGYDFRGYAQASLRRRLWRRADLEGLRSLSGLQERILHDPGCMERLLADLSINVTAMFRDPGFHRALRSDVLPELRTHPFVRVWVAGCATGEEVVSVAIALREEGMLDRTRIYATDMDADVLARARTGSFALEKVRDYTRNYISAGGTEAFSAYYAVAGERAVFDPELLRPVVFAQHNLATDGSFNEFNVVLCRNVLIYFGRDLQDRVLRLFDESLPRRGVLALGRKETLRGTAIEDRYEPVVEAERIYRRT
ncbi:protein-glutamate O-methyltransferase CheR [Solirubrobacter sp. CPCC 204708]|uniref:Protein-glutamate O-methyltransferase CheR n=1 Tax=Solirubrobacter deserti TaxID=2282478 RepID=A0ABT4RD75_9ACTN|nr:protein-glutamate O-methyltransferase CheR [Solirubrobacter deserti]MBE2315660.1 protein-glutamate O-methyltransferase CheR [Solirubrobacter deserti]MDA0136300.1 protein-glutamate O-methyltransferase CheR [Solirubrobacter deserti]